MNPNPMEMVEAVLERYINRLNPVFVGEARAHFAGLAQEVLSEIESAGMEIIIKSPEAKRVHSGVQESMKPYQHHRR